MINRPALPCTICDPCDKDQLSLLKKKKNLLSRSESHVISSHK